MSSARRRKRHNSRKVAKGGVTRKMFRDFSWAGSLLGEKYIFFMTITKNNL